MKNTNTIARAETLVVDVITAKGSALKHAGFWAAVCPLAERAYRNGNDREQWSGKGSQARPLRSCWLAAFGKNDADKLPATAGARAFRALAAFVAEQQAIKGRDLSPEGVELFLDAAETIVAGIIAPARTQKVSDEAEKAKKAIEKAITLLQEAKANHVLSSEQLTVLAGLFAVEDAAKGTVKPVTAIAAPRATRKVSKPAAEPVAA